MGKRINFIIVFKVISRNLFIVSSALLLCMLVAIIFSEPVTPFLITFIIAFSLGILLHVLTSKKANEATIQRREAYITVTLSWLSISLIGALPYIFSASIPIFTDAFFESVSGFTTTGSSILKEIESLPYSILFWRSLTHWIGGIGIIVLVIIVMPTLHMGGYHLFTLESSFQEKVQPRIKTIGIQLLVIYIALTTLELLLLLLGGMNFFESTCHAFGTIATGGFSPKNTSIAGYSPYIQYIIMIFMFLSGTNFIIHYYLIKKDLKRIRANDEFRFYTLSILFIGLIITSSLFLEMHKPLEESFREGFFQVISIVTCTGYATADYLQWPAYAWTIIFFSMFLGGSTGSTAGGIKMARHLVVFKNISRVFSRLISPNVILAKIKINQKPLNVEANNSILTYFSLYLLLFLTGSLLLMALGTDLKTASSSAATCMAGIGPGIGTVGPASNFAHLPQMGKLVLSALMLLGRLEIYTIIILLSPPFWKD